MIIDLTSAVCQRCATEHPADLIRSENRIQAVVRCPEGRQTYDISSDADMFLELRKRSSTEYQNDVAPQGRYVLNYISITNACNFSCAVCGVNALRSRQAATFLPVAEICRRAEQVTYQGGRLLHLIGGEPSLHPDLLEIVERLGRMGFSLGIVTNGYLLGKDATLARSLQKRGLKRVCLQFDSLQEETLDQLKKGYLREKQKAIQNVIQAGLGLGLNCTTTTHNLGEVSDLLTHGLSLGIAVKNMTFASAAVIGRYLFAETDSADREQIVKQLLQAGKRYHFSLDDILPLPAYLPWGIQIHPDCGVHLLLVRTPRGIRPLNHYVDLPAVYQRMSKTPGNSHLISKFLLPGYYIFRSVRPKRLLSLLHLAWGLAFVKKRYALVNIGITNYQAAAFLDKQRIERCASAFYTSVGPVKGCLHFFCDRSYPGSHEYEVLHDSC